MLLDVLIGSDYYWTVVTGETIVGDNGPIAVSSILGWLLSGPSDYISTVNLTHSNVLVNCNTDDVLGVCEGDDVVNALKHFLDTESIGVVDDSQSETEGGSFLERFQFNNGCYEIHLLWTGGSWSFCPLFESITSTSCSITEISKSPRHVSYNNTRTAEEGNSGDGIRVSKILWTLQFIIFHTMGCYVMTSGPLS